MRAARLTATGDDTAWLLVCDGEQEAAPTRTCLTGLPAHDLARQWCRRLRRVDRVVFDYDGSDWRAAVWGVGHRRSVRCRVSRQTGLALALAGVPVGLVEVDR